MRILIIRNYPTTLNLEKQSYNIQEVGLARALVKKGHCCDVVFWTDGPDKEKEVVLEGDRRITVYYVHAKNILKNGVFSKRLDMLTRQYDIVQISEYNQYQSWKYAKKLRDKMILLHGPYYSAFNKRYNLMCKVFDLFFLNRYRKLETRFMVKSSLAESFLLDKGIKRENISRVYVGIDIDALSQDGAGGTPAFVDRIENEKAGILLYIGRIEPRRRSLFLLDVFKKVLENQPDVKLVVVGDGEESYKQRFSDRIKELGLENNVEWEYCLEQKVLPRLYKKAAVFFLPTEFEIFGMVLLEAMYFYGSVITTYNGGSDTLIKNGENGIYIDGFDVDRWAEEAVKLLRDGERRKALGEAAHRTIEQNFTWDTISENYLRCYQEKLHSAGIAKERNGHNNG